MKLMMKGELQLMKTDEIVEWLCMYYCYSIAGSFGSVLVLYKLHQI